MQNADRLTEPLGISVAGILCALFEETECRACLWLEEANLKVEAFRLQFGFYAGLSDTLHSPVSAPMFPQGNYGVPAGTATDHTLAVREKIVERADFDPILEGMPGVKDFPKGTPVDQLVISSDEPDLVPLSRKPLNGKKENSSLLWFVNEEQIRFSKVLTEVDLAMISMFNRVFKPTESNSPSVVLGAGGMVMKIKSNAASPFQESSFEVATEHLLLAVALADDSLGVGAWVREQGLDPTAVYEKIDRLHNKGETPTEFDEKWGDEEENHNEISLPQESNFPEPKRAVFTAQVSLIRLLDAAANRALEAVRVVEDYVRFLLDDSKLTGQCKAFRHEFSKILSEIPHDERLASRDTRNDVGTEIQGEREYRREKIEDVLASNFSRLQESLRSLEEYGKLISVPFAQGLERLRYKAYSLQKDIADPKITFAGLPENSSETEEPVIQAIDSRSLLRESALYVLIDCRESETEFVELAQMLIDAGVDLLQLRDKKADDRTLLHRGKLLRKLTAETRTLYIMNDRPDLAKLTQADGVHVGQEELSIEEVRKIVGPEMLVGVSTHTIRQIQDAVASGADYIGVGPVFPSSTKTFDDSIRKEWSAENNGDETELPELPGLNLLRKMVEETQNDPTPIPAFAIGGITPENLDEILATGISRIAVSSVVINATDPEMVVRQLKFAVST